MLTNCNSFVQGTHLPLKAVNLGGDTDTTGIVAGGLAGIHDGLAAVPENWRTAMARAGDLTTLFEQFAASCP